METQSCEAEQALANVNAAFGEFASFYSSLLEKGIDETEYGKVFNDLSQAFKEVYITSKSNYDALALNRVQFEAGRLERDAFERSLIRVEKFIIGADFDIGLKILPQLKRVEKEILQKHIIEKIETLNMPSELKVEIKQDSQSIIDSMNNAENKTNLDQIKEYIGTGNKILELGQKIWKFAQQASPTAIPLFLKIFRVL